MREWIDIINENGQDAVWTLESAQAFLKSIARLAAENELTFNIVGGVAKRGFSHSDLDLTVEGDGDLEWFLQELERKGVHHETLRSVPGGPTYRLFLPDEREIDLFA